MTPRKNGPKTGAEPSGNRGRFQPGNPGRPKGARHKTTLAIETLLEGEAETLTRKAIEMAKGGDITALAIVPRPNCTGSQGSHDCIRASASLHCCRYRHSLWCPAAGRC